MRYVLRNWQGPGFRVHFVDDTHQEEWRRKDFERETALQSASCAARRGKDWAKRLYYWEIDDTGQRSWYDDGNSVNSWQWAVLNGVWKLETGEGRKLTIIHGFTEFVILHYAFSLYYACTTSNFCISFPTFHQEALVGRRWVCYFLLLDTSFWIIFISVLLYIPVLCIQ